MTGGEVRVKAEISWPWWTRPWIAVKVLLGMKVAVHTVVRTANNPGDVLEKDSTVELFW